MVQALVYAYIPSRMEHQNNNKLNRAFLLLLQPVARLFLRYGRGIKEYFELSKTAFVVVASEDYGVGGRPTNASRIAAMTGITRREVRRIRAKIGRNEAATTEHGTPLREVIQGWRSDPEFLDENRHPALLPLDERPGSFQALIKRYAGDIPEGAMRKELERISAVEPIGDLMRLVDPSPAIRLEEGRLATQLRSGPYPLLAAIAENHMTENPQEHWPVETVREQSIRRSDVRRVRQIVTGRLRAATTNIAELLEAYATLHAGNEQDEPTVPISAGVFYAEGIEVPDD